MVGVEIPLVMSSVIEFDKKEEKTALRWWRRMYVRVCLRFREYMCIAACVGTDTKQIRN